MEGCFSSNRHTFTMGRMVPGEPVTTASTCRHEIQRQSSKPFDSIPAILDSISSILYLRYARFYPTLHMLI